MPPHSAASLLQVLGQSDLSDFDATFLHQHEGSSIQAGDLKKAQLATPEWNTALLHSLSATLGSLNKQPTSSHRLNVKTHVFKKELQEYIPTQIEDRLRIETIIYVELSIVDQNNALVNSYDFARLPKDMFFTQPDKVMSLEEMATKRIIDISATLQCPSNGWQEEKEACLRCARRMSTKMDQTESRIMHMLPELHRTENGDALISFRSGVANIQFKINCYCGHKKEKEGFVIRFDSKSDASVASHVTLPLMFYHQNKNRVASRAAKALAKNEQHQQQQQQQQQESQGPRSIVKSVNSKSKRESRSRPGHSPIGHHQQQQQQIPSPPNSLLDSPVEWSSSPELDDVVDCSDTPFTVPSPPPPDPLISLFPDSAIQDQRQQQQPALALISHMTPSSGPVRGGTLVTIHGSGFPVGEVVYVCFGENMVPVLAQRDHMLECVTPAAIKADTVPVFAMNALDTNVTQASFTYIDDNEKELIKLALQRMMNISARIDGPVDTVLNRANEFTLWNELLQGGVDLSSGASTSCSNLESMVVKSFETLDTPASKNFEGISIVNGTGHTMLHLAVALSYESLAKDLLLRNVDTSIKDMNGLTALDWARRLGHQSLVDLLMGHVANTNLSCAPKHAEVALGLQSLVSPGADPTATDQTDSHNSGGGIATDQPDRMACTDITLDLTTTFTSTPRTTTTPSHLDPQLLVEWEGFGQGPGKVVEMDTRVEHDLFQDLHTNDLFVGQSRKDPGRLAGELMVNEHDGRHAIHQQHPTLYRRTLSAIPINVQDSMMDVTPVHDNNHTPIALHGSPPAGLPMELTGAMADHMHHAAIVNPDLTRLVDTSPVEYFQDSADCIAPTSQAVVATQGSPGWIEGIVPNNKAVVVHATQIAGAGFQQTTLGSSGINRIDENVGPPAVVVREEADVVVVGVVYGHQHDQVNTSRRDGMVEDDHVDVNDNDGESGSQNAVNKQAAVQSGQNDDESEPLLFLGGLPVTLSPRPTRTVVPTVSNSRTEMDNTSQDLDSRQNTGSSQDEA